MTSDLARIEVTDLAVGPRRTPARPRHRLRACPERQDQVRVATALSEVSRSAVMASQRAIVSFAAGKAELVILVRRERRATPVRESTAATRLMDRVEVTGHEVVMAKRRPIGVRPDRRAIAEQLARRVAGLRHGRAAPAQLRTSSPPWRT